MKRQLTSNRLNVNAGIQSWYVKELQKLTQQMTKECYKVLGELYKKGYPEIAFDESFSSQVVKKEAYRFPYGLLIIAFILVVECYIH